MTIALKLPVDTLLEQLHQISKRRTLLGQAISEHMRQAGKLWADTWELDKQEVDILHAINALGVSIDFDKGDTYITDHQGEVPRD